MTDLKNAIAELAKGGALTLASLPDGYDAFCFADLTRALAPAAEHRAVVAVHSRAMRSAPSPLAKLSLCRTRYRNSRFPRLGLPAL